MSQHKGGSRSSTGVNKGPKITLGDVRNHVVQSTQDFFAPTFNMFSAVGHNMQLPANSPNRRNPLAPPDQKPERRVANLPASARVVTQYPDGVSTGVGGGNAGQSQSIDPKGSGYIPPTGKPLTSPAPSTAPSPSTANTGRQDTRTNANGVVQTGTNTGIKPMTLNDIEGEGGLFERLGLAGTRVQDPYSSNQLPTTSSNPDSGSNEQAMFDSATDKFKTFYQKGQTGGIGPTKSAQLADSAYTEGTSAVRPNESSGQSKPIRGAVDSRFADGDEYGETYTSDMSARSRAFLDAEDSMTGLRAAEATQGIVYAGGQHNILNPNRGKEGENDFIGITNKDDVRGYKSGRLGAQELLDKHMGEAKKTNAESGPKKSTLEQPSETAGPLADADAYGNHLKQQQSRYQMSGQGPVADADEYGAMLNNQPKNSGNLFQRAQANIEQYRNR